VDALHLRKIDLFHMNKAQQLLDGARHFTPTFVTRSPALRDADLRPELLLVEAQPATYFARIEDPIEKFHGSSMFLRQDSKPPPLGDHTIPPAYFSPTADGAQAPPTGGDVAARITMRPLQQAVTCGSGGISNRQVRLRQLQTVRFSAYRIAPPLAT